MNLVFWILLGAVAGWAASIITKSGQGIVGNIILGVAGAIMGGAIIGIFGQPGLSGFNIYSLLVAIFGSVVLIWIGRMVYHTR